MKYFPLFHDLRDQICLIVGGGGVAFRKASLLLRSGTRLIVVAPRINREFLELGRSDKVKLELAPYSTDHLEGVCLVVAGTDNHEVNRRVSVDARLWNIPVNVVDQPELCTCIFPSIIDRSPVVLAVSTSARSPSLSRKLRHDIERVMPGRLGALADFISQIKPAVRKSLAAPERREFYEKLINGPIAEAVLGGDEKTALRLFENLLDSPESPTGEVYLVGAGPGDPDLLTLRALRLMQQADICLYDNLVSPEILDMVRREARREYVGKRRSEHSMPQEQINDKLVRLASAGNRVLRLKGGDPFIFGRGGEEIEKLAQHGIPFQVVPGITAANGCACYAGIPLTHRDYAQSVRFVAGHLQATGANMNWQELIAPNQTIVIYMGLANLSVICAEIINHGRDPATPIALISRGTTPQQQVYTATLASLPGVIAAQEVHGPTLIIIGEVVRLRDSLRSS